MDAQQSKPAKATAADVGRTLLRVPRTELTRTLGTDTKATETTAGPHGRVRRTEPRALARIERLVDAVAPALGLEPARVRVSVEPTNGPSSGRATPSATYLSVSQEAADRVVEPLVVHELVHLRQHQNRLRSRPDVTAAESEAAGIANALREGRTLWVPREALPDGHVARDDGALGVAPTTTTPEDAAPADSTKETAEPSVEQLERQLDRLVAKNHSGDIKALKGLLDHPWTQTQDDMVENCLRILATLQFVVARALVRALGDDRIQIALLSDAHHAAYPEQCVAVLSALTRDDFRKLAGQRTGPNTYYEGATAALHGVRADRLGTTARRALMNTFARVGPTVRYELTQSDRRAEFRALFATGPDLGTDFDDLQNAVKGEMALETQEKGVNDGTVTQVRTTLGSANSETARRALDLLQTLATKTAPLDVAATVKAALPGQPPAPKRGNEPAVVSDDLLATVAQLDSEGLIDKILDHLDSDDRNGAYKAVLHTVLSARAPLPNLSRATELLSYSLFDWAVTDNDARFAYLLVRSTPIVAQDNWRQLDNGKWLHRLEDNIPDDMFSSGEYTGVGSEYIAVPPQIPGLSPKELQAKAEEIITQWDADHSEKNALRTVRLLLGQDEHGAASPWDHDADGKALEYDETHRTAVLRRIDARQKLNDVIAALPDDFLFGERGRNDLLDLNKLRDLIALRRQARGLVPDGAFAWIFFGWATFNRRDAWIAVQAIRALPPEEQVKFTDEEPGLWSTLWTSLTPEMRRDLPTTLATGRDPRLPTRQSLRERLDDKRLWTPTNALILRSVIDLAIAADEREFVFGLSQKFRADTIAQSDTEFAALVAHFNLYNEYVKPQRLAFDPKLTPSSRLPVSFGWLGIAGRAIGVLAPMLFNSDTLQLDGYTMHLKAFNLGDVQQVVGGDIFGVTLDESREKIGANHITVDATFEQGFIVNIALNDLQIAGVNFVLPGKSYKSGPVRMRGLKATAGFSDRHYREPSYVGLQLDSLMMNDFVIVDPALPFSAAWAIARLALQSLAFRATQDGSGDPIGKFDQKLPEGTVPIPFLGRLWQMLSNIVGLYGAIPGDETLLDLALLPVTHGMSFWKSTLITTPADLGVPTPGIVSHLWGLASDGVLRPPYSAAQRMKDMIATLRAFGVSFDSLDIGGVSLGSGVQIGSIALHDVNLGIGQSLPAYLRTALSTVENAQSKLPKDSQQYKDLDARAATLRAQIAATEATPRIKELRAKRKDHPGQLTEKEKQELAVAEKNDHDEQRLTELEAKDRWHPGSLSKEEREQLLALNKKLRSTVGISAEIGSLSVGPISGDIESGGVTMTGVHAYAKLPNVGILPYAAGYLDDKTLAEQFVAAGPTVPSVAELAKSSEFSLTVDATQVLKTDPEQPALVIKAKADELPTSAELLDRYMKLPVIPGNEPIRDRLARAIGALVQRDAAIRITQSPTTDDAEKQAAQQRVIEFTDKARKMLGIEVGGIKLGRITGQLDPATGNITATLHDAQVIGLKTPGFAIDMITGSLDVGLSTAGVTERPDQLGKTAPQTLTGQLAPSFGLKNVSAMGIHLPQGEIGEVKVGSLTGKVRQTKDGLEIYDVLLDKIEIDSVSIGEMGNGVQAISAVLEGIRLDVLLGFSKTATGSELARALVKSFHIDTIGAKGIVANLTTRSGPVMAVIDGGSLHNIDVNDLDIQKGAAGWDALGGSASVGSLDNLKFQAVIGALKSAKTISGTITTADVRDKEGKRVPLLTASFAKAKDGTTINLDLQNLMALNGIFSSPDGSVQLRRLLVAASYTQTPKGASASATVTDIKLGAVDWQVGDLHVTSHNALSIKKITAAATGTKKQDVATPNMPNDFDWSIDAIDLYGLESSDLRVQDYPIDLHLSTPSSDGGPPLRIEHIHANPAKKSITVTDFNAELAGKLTYKLQAGGNVHFDSLQLDLSRAGHTIATLHGLRAGAAVLDDGSGFTGIIGVNKLGGAVGIEGVDARVDIGPDSILIGSEDPAIRDGLSIRLISVSSLDFASRTEKGKRYEFKTAPGGRVDLFGIRARVRIDKWKPGEKHTGTSPFKQATIEHFLIDKVNVGGFEIDLLDDDISIVVQPRAESDPPTINRVEIGGEKTGGGTEDPMVIDLTSMKYQGGVDIAGLTLPVSAKVKDMFKGDAKLTTDHIKLGFVAEGGVKIDVDNPELTIKGAVQLGDSSIRVGKIGFKHLTADKGAVTATGTHVDDLSYELKMYGRTVATLTVPKATLPKDAKYDTETGNIDIDSLDIENAYLDLDLATLMPPPPITGGSSKDDDSGKPEDVTLKPLIDSVNGTVKVVLFVRANVVHVLTDIQVGTEAKPLVVPITKGSVDIPTFEKNAEHMVSAIDEPGPDIPQSWIGFFARDPMLRLDNEKRTLELGIYVSDPPQAKSGNDKKLPTRTTVYTEPTGPGEMPVAVTVTDEKRPHDGWQDILTWDVTSDLDLEEARKDRFHLWTAIFHMHKDAAPTDKDKAWKKAIKTQAILDSLEIRSLDADLSVENAAPVPIPIKSQTVNGSITLSEHALMHLTIKGGIPPVVKPEGRPGTNPGALDVGLEAVKLDSVDLKMVDPAPSTGSHQLKTGSIKVGTVHDVRVVLDSLFGRPQRITGTINAHAENIHWSKLAKK